MENSTGLSKDYYCPQFRVMVADEISTNVMITITPQFANEFVALVQRAANLWPDASPAMKTFCDVVTNGKPMQDYMNLGSEKHNTAAATKGEKS